MDNKGIRRWIAEYKFDEDSGDRIIRVLDNNPVSLSRCADILEAVATLCEIRVIPMFDAVKYLALSGDECEQEAEALCQKLGVDGKSSEGD